MDKYGNKIIAVDFDKTLSMARYPEVGEPNMVLISKLIEEQKKGTKIVLNTCRTGENLHKAVFFCNKYGLFFDAVNDNVDTIIESYGDNPRKISADVYIDDKAIKPLTMEKYNILNTIEVLADQMNAMLDLMMTTEDSVYIRSIKTASEMCMTTLDGIMEEVEKLKEQI